MLEKSDTNITETLARFNELDIDVALLVPTRTGIEKSIMDATASLREYFADVGFHDYASQGQGPEHKVVLPAFFVWPDRLEETSVSLYRPCTKSGDPRAWFSGLGRYAEPNNLLAVFVHRERLYVVNCSRHGILATIHDRGRPLGALVAEQAPHADPAAEELLEMMREVSGRGFLPTLRSGDTGVGMTLETLLGIAANTNRAPDYKGIEIKAKRLRRSRSARTTLFSQVPDWKLSPIGSAWNLLSAYGYHRDGKLRLNHEIDATAPNSIGFVLEVDAAQDWLKQNHVDPATSEATHVVTWPMEKLRSRLREKHPQTFWVGAKTRGRGACEEFHYVQVEHTRQPRARNLAALIEGGVVSVDYLMSQRGEASVRDHGYLFKMHSSDLKALFPPAEVHVLA